MEDLYEDLSLSLCKGQMNLYRGNWWNV